MAPALPPGSLAEISKQLFTDEPGDGRVWARGRTYKASFGHDGFVYTPFLGSDAARSFPLSFELSGATVGGDALPLGGVESAVLDGKTVSMDRGTVREVYHLTAETVEQTFVFDELPATGDVRLRVDVTTDLDVTEMGGGFVFENDLGEVHYGSATAIDATGRSLRLEQSWTGTGFEVVVPATFVADALLPLTIDPTISTFAVTNDGRRQIAVDTAYDSQNDVYQIVYSEVESALDQDVITVFYNATLGTLVLPSSIDITSAWWGQPSTANCYQDQTFICVNVVGFFVGARKIWGRTRHAGTGARSAQFEISPTGGEFADVGGFGNDTNTSFDFAVVWQQAYSPIQDFDIVAQGVSSGGSLVGPRTVLAPGLSNLDRRPRISKSSGRTSLLAGEHRYMVVWDREVSPTNHDIWARVIDYDIDTTGHARFRAYSFSDALDADVSVQATSIYSSEPYWVMVFERLIGADYEVYSVVAREGNPDNARNISVMQDVDVQLNQLDPKIAFDGLDYLIAYHSENPGGGQDAYFTVLNVQADSGELRGALSERRDTLSLGNGTAASVAISSHWDGGGPIGGGVAGDALTLWVAERQGGSDGEVDAAIVVDIRTNAVGVQYCDANENSTGRSAWMRATFDGHVRPNSWITLHCQDLPPNSFGHFIVADHNAVTANPGGSAGNLCLSGSVGRYSNAVASSGPSGRLSLNVNMGSIPQPFGPIVSPPATRWYFQCWTRDSDNGTATSNFSNAVAVYVE